MRKIYEKKQHRLNFVQPDNNSWPSSQNAIIDNSNDNDDFDLASDIEIEAIAKEMDKTPSTNVGYSIPSQQEQVSEMDKLRQKHYRNPHIRNNKRSR